MSKKDRIKPAGELYHVASDPTESADVSARYPGKREALKALYERLTRDLPKPEQRGKTSAVD